MRDILVYLHGCFDKHDINCSENVGRTTVLLRACRRFGSTTGSETLTSSQKHCGSSDIF